MSFSCLKKRKIILFPQNDMFNVFLCFQCDSKVGEICLVIFNVFNDLVFSMFLIFNVMRRWERWEDLLQERFFFYRCDSIS